MRLAGEDKEHKLGVLGSISRPHRGPQLRRGRERAKLGSSDSHPVSTRPREFVLPVPPSLRWSARPAPDELPRTAPDELTGLSGIQEWLRRGGQRKPLRAAGSSAGGQPLTLLGPSPEPHSSGSQTQLQSACNYRGDEEGGGPNLGSWEA